MNLELNDTLVFVKIVELGSFSGAARALAVPKSTLTRRVQQLERSLGTRLMERTTRRLALTAAGQVYFERCARIATDLGEAESAVGQLSGAPRGWLRITLPFALGTAFAPLIPQFTARFPDVRLDVQISNEFVDLMANELDIALRVGKLPDSSLVARRIMHFPAHLYASPSYIARNGEPLEPEDLTHHRVVAANHPRKNSRVQWNLTGPVGSREISIEPVVIANDPTVLRAAAIGGVGIALMGDVLLHGAVAEGKLRRVLAAWAGPGADLNAVFPQGRSSSPKVRAFLDFITESWDIAGSLASATTPPRIE